MDCQEGKVYDNKAMTKSKGVVRAAPGRRRPPEPKRAGEALRENEERLRLALSSARFGTFDFNPLTGDLGWDAQNKRIWGIRPTEEIDFTQALKRIHPEDRERISQIVASSLAPEANGDYEAEYRIVWPDGTLHWSSAKGRVYFELHDGKRRAVRMIGVQRDITAHKEAEEALRRAKEDLARANEHLELKVQERTARLHDLVEDLEHFSFTITHDLKSPLRAMRGWAEIAASDCKPKGVKEALAKISTAAERMEGLITNALDYSRTVRQEFRLTAVDTGALLRRMLDSHPELQTLKAHIRVKGQMPVVLGNEAGVTQCFSNLLGNAGKFVKSGDRPEIRVWAEERDGWARIWIQDKGIGISKEMLPRVFDMFSRGSQDYEGTGIGLALVRKVTQRMGGRVGVESEEGKGSRFWIELRLAAGFQ